MANIDDLDQLLDSALDDFQTFNLNHINNNKNNSSLQSDRETGTGNIHEGLPSLSSGVQGLGMGLPDLRVKKKGKQKAVSKDTHVSEALDKLREQTREAVKGLEYIAAPKLGADDLGKDAMEDWVKQFEDLAGTQDMESIVETMMQQLLSKEILHEPMKEIGERYPKWLEEHKITLSKEEYDRYSKQYELIRNLNEVYEKDPGNFNKVVELMHKMQECGQPPNDIVKELAPDFDLASLGQLSPEMLESQANCCIM
ncbi:hypothetical protein TanjilG_05447 [Lupinus angustifolius]|uniref:Uncharacterized protein n=1 Tax=Lupinus angustifolius TaxID=3871 RepID=A0A4P1QSX2_LUPAN|nr:PREDICTED: peroxisome biogenesis protein 19-1-like isoform X2 [Lupinus angustifolius]OIV94067.1 hypothetical protein TanjilG_05447 [Lupinus angustifolius]